MFAFRPILQKRIISFTRMMRLTYLILGLSLATLGYAITCYECTGSNGLCSSQSDNGNAQGCNSGSKCWVEHGK